MDLPLTGFGGFLWFEGEIFARGFSSYMAYFAPLGKRLARIAFLLEKGP